MATAVTNEWGDVIESPAPTVNEFGDAIETPAAQPAVNEYGDAIESNPPQLADTTPRPLTFTTSGGTTGLGWEGMKRDLQDGPPPAMQLVRGVLDPVREAQGGDAIVNTLPTVARIGGPIAGLAAAPFTLGASLPAGLAMAVGGAALAEPLAQGLEVATDQRDSLNYNEGVLNTAIGGPAAMIGLPGARAVTTTAQRITRAAAHAATGGVTNAAQGAIMRGARNEPQDLATSAKEFGTGALFSTILGTTFDELARAGRLDQAWTAARSAGFTGQTEAELRAWLDAQRFARARPAAESPQPGMPMRPTDTAAEASPISQEPTSGTGAVPPNTAAPKPTADGSTPSPATTSPLVTRPAPSAADLRAGIRTARLGNLATLSNEQLATLSRNLGTTPSAPAAPATQTPAVNDFGDAVETPGTPAVSPPPAASFEELSQLWAEAGVTLKFNELPNGDTELTVLTVPKDQRSQGIGSIVLQEVQQVAEALKKPVQLSARPLDTPITGKTEEEIAPQVAAFETQKQRLGAWYERSGFRPVNRGSYVAKTRNGDVVKQRDPIYRFVPYTVPRVPGKRPGFGSRPDGVEDLLDDIYQEGGVPKPPADAAGQGEWDGWESAFSNPSARLLVHPRARGGIDKFIAQLNDTGKYRFTSPDDFYDAIGLALEGRRRAKIVAEQQANQGKFYDAALANKGRTRGEKSDAPVPVNTLGVGDTFKIKGEPLTVTDISPADGETVIAKDGERFGTVELPPYEQLYPDEGTFKSAATERAQTVNEWGDIVEDSAANINDEPAATNTSGGWQTRNADLAETYKTAAITLHAAESRLTAEMQASQLMLPPGYVTTPYGPDTVALTDTNGNDVAYPLTQQEAADRAWEHAGMTIQRERQLEMTRNQLERDLDLITLRARTTQASKAWTANGQHPDTAKFVAEQAAAEAAQAKKTAAQAKARKTRASTAAASPGSASPDAYPGPEAFNEPTPPVDDPSFSALPAELPEAVQFYRQLTGGQYPKIREKIRVLKGKALGVFYAMPGQRDSGRIELRADIFRLVSDAERNRLLEQAITWAKLASETGSTVPLQELVEGRFNQLVKAAEQKALTENPRQALAVLWHEIGHFADFLPDATLKRGNLLGHIAALKRNFKPFISEHPGMDPQATPPTRKEQDQLRRQAEKELGDRVKEVVEVIRREEPVYRELPITADNITSILKTAQRDEFPGLYDWFASLERADKASVLRSAMKGVVDGRAAQFSRREATGETRTVEEIKRTTTGIPATPEEIRARFDELLRAELRRRGLISERELRAEAAEVIKWWQGVDEVPKYFQTATETWAELFSATMNNPAGVAKRAPTFWRAFNAYLEARPEVAKIYRATQDSIKSGSIHRERVLNLRDMFHRDEDNSLLADSMFQAMEITTLRDTFSVVFNRQTGPIQRRALDILKKNKNDKVAAAALSSLKNYLYRATGWESFARDLNLHVEAPLAAANLHHDDMSEFLFHSRIASGDRQQLANPLGWSPKTSAERLQTMEAELGPQRWATLEESAVTFRAIYEEQVVSLLKEANILTPELLQIIEDRTQYATFAKAREFNPLEAGTLQGALENRYGKDVTARIYRQIGTLGEIRSPYLATVQKAFSIISTARRQIALKSIVNFLAEHEPQSIIPAEERFIMDSRGGRWEPAPMDTRQVGTLYTLNAGKVEAFYVPRGIYEMMDHSAPLEATVIGLAHKALTWPKAILTELNPGFWPIAFAKDIVTMAVQLPKGMRAVKQLPAAFTAARASMTSKPSPLADAALRRLMVISRADSRGEHLGQADELTRILMRMGQTPQLWDAEAEKISRFLRFWMAWKRQGQTLERTIKFAGMKHLDEAFPDMPEWQKKRIVNEQSGSPDFLEKGRAAPLVDLWMMFYNPWLRGVEAMKTSAQGDPRGFWTKFLGTVGLAATAYWMFEQGMINGGLDPEEAEDKRDMMRSIPERDKRRGFAVPLAWSDKEQGKVAYIVLPFPDSLRYLHTAQRTLLQSMEKDGTAGEGFKSFLSYQGQDLPGQNPMITEAGKWYDYHVLGRNPYDEFLGRGALPDDMVTAGNAGGELAMQSLSNITGGIIYRHRQDRPGEKPTGMEEFLQTPVVGNLLGRWVRVSNRGLTEQTEQDVASVRQREAELRLVGEEMIGRQMRGEAWTQSQEQLFTEEPYLAQRIVNRQMDLMKQATAPEMRAWDQAKSQGERMALLDAWSKREAEKENRLNK